MIFRQNMKKNLGECNEGVAIDFQERHFKVILSEVFNESTHDKIPRKKPRI